MQVTKVPTTNDPIAPITESIAVTLKCQSGDTVPERNIKLSKNQPTIVGRATVSHPASRANAMYQLPQLGPVHALLNWTGSSFQIKSMSPTYRTWLNGNVIQQHEQRQVEHCDELIFGAHQTSDNVVVSFLVDKMPLKPPTNYARTVKLLLATGRKQTPISITIDDGESIQLGRREADYICQRNELMFRSEIVSRTHAILMNRLGEIIVRDENSTNGTYVNAVLLKAFTDCTLKTGDKLQLGAADVADAHPVIIQFHCELMSRKKMGEQMRTLARNRALPITLTKTADYVTLSVNSRVLLAAHNLNNVPNTCASQANSQWLTVAVAAIAKHQSEPVDTWNETVLNDVLRNGDQLYGRVVLGMEAIQRYPPENGCLNFHDLLVLNYTFVLDGRIYDDGTIYEPFAEGQFYSNDAASLHCPMA